MERWFGRFSREGVAYVAPFAVFMGGLALAGLLGWAGGEEGPFWLREAKYWVYPLQTLACAGVLAWFWRCYEWGPWLRTLPEAAGWGVVVFVLWISPQLMGQAGRFEGFNPWVLGEGGVLVWGSLVMRLARLVVVVPLVEEIFWRGFLMRWFVAEGRWREVPFGTLRLASFSGVVVLFMFVHQIVDFFGAMAAGVIYGVVAVRTRSMGACVVSHAVTNGLLGVYILVTKQWGFW